MSAKSPTPTTRKPPLNPKPQKTPKKPPTKTKRRPGRPLQCDPEKAKAKIIEFIENGGSLLQACKLKGTPGRATVLRWKREDEQFEALIARAREEAQDFHVDSVQEIVKKTLSGKLDPNAARVAISSIQWTAGKLAQKRYGEKQQLEIDDRRQLADAIREVAEAAHRARLEAKGLLIEGELVGDKEK